MTETGLLQDEPSMLLMDLGGWTVDLMRIDNAIPAADTAHSLELGMIRCVDDIREQVRRETGLSLTDAQIENMLAGQPCTVSDTVRDIVNRQGRKYTEHLLSATMEAGFDLHAITAVLLTRGVNAWLTLPIAILEGTLAGLFTGLIHVRLKIRNLLAGIITMTALFSVNLQIAGSNLAVDRDTDTIFTSPAVMALFGDMTLMGRKLVISLLLLAAVKVLLDLYFKTKSGLLLRAVGDNAGLVTALAKDRGSVKILGLAISNALVALAGCIVCHDLRSYSATMGTGQLVYGLAAVIIGDVVFGKIFINFALRLLSVVFGSIIYYAVYSLVIWLGMSGDDMKLITSVIVALFLSIPYWKGKYFSKPAAKKANKEGAKNA